MKAMDDSSKFLVKLKLVINSDDMSTIVDILRDLALNIERAEYEDNTRVFTNSANYSVIITDNRD